MYVPILFLSATGALGSLLLYFVARRFKVDEDPRIEEVLEALPGANCGGCGYPGCSGFATACAKASTLDNLYCPVGGAPTMSRVAEILGMDAANQEPMVAVVRCNGDCEARPRTNIYDGAGTCKIASVLYGGDTDCSFGCLGLGDCELSCPFDAIHINPTTRLPEVIEEKCTACGACVRACPKMIIELRRRGPKSRRIFVSCVNKDKGAKAKKACANACIGCSKCQKECKFEAITIENNLSYIDHTKCRLCRKCVPVCPTQCIHEVNLPPKKQPAPAPASADKAPTEPSTPPTTPIQPNA